MAVITQWKIRRESCSLVVAYCTNRHVVQLAILAANPFCFITETELDSAGRGLAGISDA